MDRYYSQIIGTKIVTESAELVGVVCDVVIHPDNGKVIGFIALPNNKKVLCPQDVLFWDQVMIVHEQSDIFDVEEIIKVDEVMKEKIKVYGNKVYSKNGTFLGKVYDYSIHNKLFTLTNIAVGKSVLGLFLYSKRVINSRDIIEIKKNKIIVKDDLITVPVDQLAIESAPTTG